MLPSVGSHLPLTSGSGSGSVKMFRLQSGSDKPSSGGSDNANIGPWVTSELWHCGTGAGAWHYHGTGHWTCWQSCSKAIWSFHLNQRHFYKLQHQLYILFTKINCAGELHIFLFLRLSQMGSLLGGIMLFGSLRYNK